MSKVLKYINTHRQDAVIYKANALLKVAGDDHFERAEAVEAIKEMLGCISSEILLEYYVKLIAGIAGVKSATLTKEIRSLKDEEKKKVEQHVGEGKSALPAWINKERWNDIGFDWRIDKINPENTGTYFPMGIGGHQVRLTNFVIKPIVQIISHNANLRRRITEVRNGKAFHVFELPSAAFTSITRLEAELMDQGNYHFEDGFSQSSLNKLKSYYLDHYPEGYEISTLGWQPEGFFAFSNIVYSHGLRQYDEYGLVDVEGTNYLSMGASNILKNLRKGTGNYEDNKLLRYIPAPIGFKKWTKLMLATYEDKAMIGIAGVFLAINRDIVMDISKYCPLLYFYGATGSGKTKMADSVVNLFTPGVTFLNLNQVTIPAFWDYTGLFSNIIRVYNEFDVNGIDERLSKAFKGFVENEGRKTNSGVRGRSETQQVTCLALMLGQYIAIIDDGAVLNRSLAEKFVDNPNRPEEMLQAYRELKEYEKIGLSGLICDVLEHRELVAKNYQVVFHEIKNRLTREFKAEGVSPKDRVVENYNCVLALVKIYAGVIDMAFTYEEFYAYCKHKIINLNSLVGESNSLGEFWKTVERLASQSFGTIEPGWDYRIETQNELKSMIADKSSKNVFTFDKPTRFLFIRFNQVWGAFAKEKKATSGKNAVDDTTIKGYLKDQPYYVGAQSNGNFKSKRTGQVGGTSSMVLNYDLLLSLNDINLPEPNDDQAPEPVPTETAEGFVEADARLQSDFGIEKMAFTLMDDQSYVNDRGFSVQKIVKTYCKWKDSAMIRDLKLGARVKVTGVLVISKGERQYRNMEVQAVEILIAVVQPDEGELPGRTRVRPSESLFGKMNLRDNEAPEEYDTNV